MESELCRVSAFKEKKNLNKRHTPDVVFYCLVPTYKLPCTYFHEASFEGAKLQTARNYSGSSSQGI